MLAPKNSHLVSLELPFKGKVKLLLDQALPEAQDALGIGGSGRCKELFPAALPLLSQKRALTQHAPVSQTAPALTLLTDLFLFLFALSHILLLAYHIPRANLLLKAFLIAVFWHKERKFLCVGDMSESEARVPMLSWAPQDLFQEH